MKLKFKVCHVIVPLFAILYKSPFKNRHIWNDVIQEYITTLNKHINKRNKCGFERDILIYFEM